MFPFDQFSGRSAFSEFSTNNKRSDTNEEKETIDYRTLLSIPMLPDFIGQDVPGSSTGGRGADGRAGAGAGESTTQFYDSIYRIPHRVPRELESWLDARSAAPISQGMGETVARVSQPLPKDVSIEEDHGWLDQMIPLSPTAVAAAAATTTTIPASTMSFGAASAEGSSISPLSTPPLPLRHRIPPPKRLHSSYQEVYKDLEAVTITTTTHKQPIVTVSNEEWSRQRRVREQKLRHHCQRQEHQMERAGNGIQWVYTTTTTTTDSSTTLGEQGVRLLQQPQRQHRLQPDILQPLDEQDERHSGPIVESSSTTSTTTTTMTITRTTAARRLRPRRPWLTLSARREQVTHWITTSLARLPRQMAKIPWTVLRSTVSITNTTMATTVSRFPRRGRHDQESPSPSTTTTTTTNSNNNNNSHRPTGEGSTAVEIPHDVHASFSGGGGWGWQSQQLEAGHDMDDSSGSRSSIHFSDSRYSTHYWSTGTGTAVASEWDDTLQIWGDDTSIWLGAHDDDDDKSDSSSVDDQMWNEFLNLQPC